MKPRRPAWIGGEGEAAAGGLHKVSTAPSKNPLAPIPSRNAGPAGRPATPRSSGFGPLLSLEQAAEDAADQALALAGAELLDHGAGDLDAERGLGAARGARLGGLVAAGAA